MVIRNIADAIKNTSVLLDNVTSEVTLVSRFILDYIYVDSVITYLDSKTKLNSVTTIINNIDTNTLIQNTDINYWSDYFIKKDLIFSTTTYINIVNSTIDRSLLTMNTLEELSIIKDNVINSNYLYYNKDVSFDNTTINTILPFSRLKEIYGMIGESVHIVDLSKWNININIGDVDVTNSNNMLVVDGIKNNTLTAKFRKIKDYVSEVNKDNVQDNFISKEGVISKYSFIPEDATHNIETLENLLNKPFKKSGDSVVLEMKDNQSSDMVLSAVNEYFENGSIFDIITNNGNYFIQKQNLSATINNIVGQYRL